ncbi:MAG: hypothetical protein A3F67_07465 [Verrucomicrobia bacterium RIFCSPHIGHO2_12_FULL_41_10]|nr:MAG: hypothetical protein A3F67_07465 [Verrucomicrobia bacterium RIFCSPHIGHO2_12_FULL_41_10]HLB32805.1 NAD(P)-dependent oxidoreductase [Chthoniobacterales bacterium]
MKILVTGGSGFLGRNVIKALLKEGHSVIGFSRSQPSYFVDKKNVEWIQGDFATGEGLDSIPWEELDAVFHLAAAGVKSSKREWSECIQVNIIGTERLLQLIGTRALKKPKIFIAKTFYEKVINDVQDFKKNPYIVTKEAASQLAELWSKDYQGVTIFGTLYHAFGPNDDPSSVLSYAARQLKLGKPARFSSGKALGDWLYVTDMAEGILAALKASEQGVYHWDIGSGNLTTVRHLIEQLLMISGRSSEQIVFDPGLDRTESIIQEAAQKLPPGFIPKLTLQEGLKEHYQLQ